MQPVLLFCRANQLRSNLPTESISANGWWSIFFLCGFWWTVSIQKFQKRPETTKQSMEQACSILCLLCVLLDGDFFDFGFALPENGTLFYSNPAVWNQPPISILFLTLNACTIWNLGNKQLKSVTKPYQHLLLNPAIYN